MAILKKLNAVIQLLKNMNKAAGHDDAKSLALGKLLSNQQNLLLSPEINDYEFKVFSQWGDDGIIQYMVKHLRFEAKTFIEFGVGDYMESNTRFLLMNDYWSGYVMDGSVANMQKLRSQPWFWMYSLRCKDVFIDADNINQLLAESDFSKLGILSVDLDGNDYHILKSIDLSQLSPAVIIMEYNSVFGNDRAITVPYRKTFDRTKAHYSNLYFGASLGALALLASQKGYSLVVCTNAGNNAFFVRNDLLNDKVRKKSVKEAFRESTSRESRDEHYNLSYLQGEKRLDAIRGLPVINVETGLQETL